MLVLTRKPGQALVADINGVEVKITVLTCNQYKAKIGIQAPTTVRVLREELIDVPDSDEEGAITVEVHPEQTSIGGV